jgi:hypothetical protein
VGFKDGKRIDALSRSYPWIEREQISDSSMVFRVFEKAMDQISKG